MARKNVKFTGKKEYFQVVE